MTLRWTVAALLLAGGLAPPAGAQSYASRQINLPPSVAALVRTLLTSVSWGRRAEAAEQLGLTGEPRVLESLATAAAHDTSPEVRRAARGAIRQIRGDQGRPPPIIPGPFPPQRPQDPNAVLIDSWYQRYLGRSADAPGLAPRVAQMQRGVPAVQVLADLLASDEYWDKTGGNLGSWVSGLYQDVLGRTPNRDEVLNWAQRYRLHRENRSTVGREFLEAAETELLRGRQQQTYPW